MDKVNSVRTDVIGDNAAVNYKYPRDVHYMARG